MTDRAERLQLITGQVLGFVDEDGQPAALLMRGFRMIPDELADVGLELPGIAVRRFCGDLEPEGPCAG